MGVPAPPGVFDRNLVASEGEPLADVFTAIRKYFESSRVGLLLMHARAMGISDADQLDDDVTGALQAAGCGDAKVQVGGMFDSHGCSSWCKEARSKIDCNRCDCVSVMSAAARLTTCHMRASCARAREQIAYSTPTTHANFVYL